MTISMRIPSRGNIALPKPAAAKDFRLWVGVFLILAASIFGGKIFASASHRMPAVVVTHNLVAGSAIQAGDVQIMNVAVPAGVAMTSAIDDVVGKYVTQDVAPGSLLNPLTINENGDSSLRSISVPIKAGHLPEITYGTRVDVWFTPSLDGAVAPGPASLLAADVVVQEVPQVLDSSVDNAITLRVSDQVVALIVQALRDGTIDIAVIGGQSHG